MDNLEILQAQQTVYRKYSVPSKAIKPCVNYILARNPKSKIFTPNDHVYLIATELRRIGEEKQKATITLKAWNNGNSQALRLNELNGIIDHAYSKNYTYGCNRLIVREQCPDKENCTYCKGLYPRKRRRNESDFYKHSWQRILTPSQICLYHGLIEIEKIQKLIPGELIIATLPAREIP